MIPEKETVKISKFLSLVLRHQPETIGISLDENGWTDVSSLLQKMNAKGTALTRDILEHVVANNNKKRFAFNEDGSKIRASQGHSVSVDLAYRPQLPPGILYHGTAERFVASIQASGLEKKDRHHVHLSADKDTAVNVGTRHGKPVVFTVAAARMAGDGYAFFQSENGVWLTDHVPVQYLQLL